MDPVAVIRSKAYLSALVLAALLGAPISAVAYGFLVLVTKLQAWLFTDLPADLFGGAAPAWWPVPWVTLAGLLTALTIRHLPGNAGHSPALGFAMGGGPPRDRDLPGVVLAALATLGLGAVLGPEAPLIAIGGGLAALTVRLAKKDAPPMAVTIMASAGSFAAISTLLGSPLLGAFLIMEAAGIAGATLSLVALPGLLASGVGALVFIGLDSWTGLGTFSLALTTVPPEVTPTVASLLWAVPMGLAGALIGWAIRWVGLSLRPLVHASRVLVTAGLGLLVGLSATVYQVVTGNSFTHVLFSGQDALPDARRRCRGLLRRGARRARCVQGGRVRAVPQRLPRRSRVPGDVHRRRAGHGRQRAARAGPRTGDRDGDRRAVLRHAAPAPDLDAPGNPPARRRRPVGDAAGDRRGGGGLRRHHRAPTGRGRRAAAPTARPLRSPRVGEPQPSAPPR